MNDKASLFALVFTIAVLAQAAMRLWLGARQVRALQGHRNRVPAPFIGRIALAEQQKGADYSAARARLSRWNAAQDVLFVLVLTVGGGIAALARQFERLALPHTWNGVLLILATMALLQLAGLPLACWRTFVLEQRFGFNRSTPVNFIVDQVKGVGVAAAIGTPLLFAALWIMERTGPAWWLWALGLWIVTMLVLTWAVPLFIAPLFNRFVPLADPVLLGRVQSLLKRCGFTADGGVFVMDGSRRSAHGNAYFTGFGRAKRIVFFDTLLERMSADEIEAILTHELGHFRLHHLQQRLLVSVLTAALGLGALAWFARQDFFYAAFGIGVPSAAAALLLFIMITPVVSYFLTPLESWWSRRHERQADQFAVAHSSATDLSAALVKLYRDNADGLTPDPLYSRFYYSHPTALERIGWLDARAAT